MIIDEIRSLDIDGVNARMAEIENEMNAEGADFEALNAEVDAINERKAELKNAQNAAAELRAKVAAGEAGEIRKTFEEKNKMEERTFAIDTAEYRDAFLKILMGKEVTAEERTAVTTAGSVIPTEVANKIYGKLEKSPLFDRVNASHIRGYVQVPKATTVGDASWSNYADSADVIGSVTLGECQLIKTLEITADMQNTSVAAFQSWLVDRLAEKMKKAICTAIVKGSGSGEPQGIKTAVSAISGISTVTYDNLLTMMGTLGSAYHDGAVWIMTADKFFNGIMKLKDTANRPLIVQGVAGIEGAPVYKLFGHDVILDESAKTAGESSTTNHIFFGNLGEGYAFNFAKDIEITSDASVSFRNGSTVYRAMALCDGKVVDAEAFVRIDV